MFFLMIYSESKKGGGAPASEQFPFFVVSLPGKEVSGQSFKTILKIYGECIFRAVQEIVKSLFSF